MSEATTENVQIKIFIGTLLSHDIKKHLNQCSSWKDAKITWQNEKSEWKELHYQNKDYFGKYIPSQHISLPELKNIEAELQKIIQSHFEELPVDKLKVILFPQLFVT